MWENNEYKISLEEQTLFEHERVMLSSGECSYLFPMIFIGEKGKSVAYYDVSGYSPLCNFRIERTDDALYILEKVLLILGQVVEYLITPAKVTLSLETVFYNIETGSIKIAYVPVAGDNASLKHNLLSFISMLKKEIYDSHTDFLDKTAKLIHYNNYQPKDIVNSIGLFRRELYALQHRN